MEDSRDFVHEADKKEEGKSIKVICFEAIAPLQNFPNRFEIVLKNFSRLEHSCKEMECGKIFTAWSLNYQVFHMLPSSHQFIRRWRILCIVS